MIAEKLRKAVLQAAMEGKLTEQLSDDGNAIEYITKYKIKKINDIADFPKIPKSWIYTNLGEIGIWKAGSTPLRSKTEYYQNGNIPWLKTGDLNNGIIYDIPECITEKALNETSLKLNPVGSILMAMYGATIGKLGILGIEATTNQACIACITKDFVYNKFLFYYLYSEQDKFIKKGVGGAQPNISREKIVATEFPLPPIEEQKRIVEKLEVLLAEIDKLEQDEIALKKLEDKFPERLKSAILQAAIQGRISNQSIDKDNSYNHSGINGNKQTTYEEIDKTGLVVPTTWRFYKLVDVSDVIGGYAFKSSEYLKSNIENGVRVIRISDFNNDGLIDNSPVYYDEDNKLSRYEIRENDILLCMTGGTVGKNTLVNNIDKKLYLNQRVAAIRNNSPSLLNTEYLHIVLNTPYIQKIINDSKNSTNDNISMRQINNFIIPIPPLKEQIEIINKIKKLSINIETM